METRLVTAFYFDNYGGDQRPPYHMHSAVARYHRYLYSIVQLSRMNLPIKLVCGENVYDALTIELQHNNVKNIEVEVRDLSSFKYSKKIGELKNKYPEKFNFYHEIDWAKLDLLKEEAEKGADYTYWIDCGLAHRGLWPDRYSKSPDTLTGFSHDRQNYEFDKVFNPHFFTKINEWVGDKLIDIRSIMQYHPFDEINKLAGEDICCDGQTIGGILGGNKNQLDFFINNFYHYADLCLSDDKVLNHEAIITTIAHKNSEKFKTFKFDTWYHENTGGMDWITPEWLDTQVSFYEFIKEIDHE
tara:strand:- start:1325 stop:2224 length:900 start_codon:yes stop_codon:yes gene_type:complete